MQFKNLVCLVTFSFLIHQSHASEVDERENFRSEHPPYTSQSSEKSVHHPNPAEHQRSSPPQSSPKAPTNHQVTLPIPKTVYSQIWSDPLDHSIPGSVSPHESYVNPNLYPNSVPATQPNPYSSIHHESAPSDSLTEPPCRDLVHIDTIPVLLAEEIANTVRKIRPKKPSHEEFVKAVNMISPGPKSKDTSYDSATGRMHRIQFIDFYSFMVDHLNYLEETSRSINQPRQWAPLSTDEVLAINLYTGDYYGMINRNLDMPAFQAYKEMTSYAMSKVPKYPGTVLRGEQLGANGLALMQPGKTVAYTGFLSTSPTSPFEGNVRLTIHGESGRNIKAFSDVQRENEVLFTPGTVLEILERTEPELSDQPINIVAREVPKPDEPSTPLPWD